MAGNDVEFGVAVERLCFPEGPRWHLGALWFSDIRAGQVMRYTPGDAPSVVAAIPGGHPSGLGWLPDGRLLVVDMEARKLLRMEATGQLVEHADLTAPARGMINDMVVSDDGTAYVGDGGYPGFGRTGERQMGQTFRVSPLGELAQVEDDLVTPNGHILTPDGRMLIVAETHRSRLTAFDVGSDGTLSGRRVFASLGATAAGPVRPDGICLDAEGGVWLADLISRQVRRVVEGGQVTASLSVGDAVPLACVLGGDDRRTLFVCTVPSLPVEPGCTDLRGRVLAMTVDIPGAGRP